MTLSFVAIVIGVTRRPIAPFSVWVAHYDPIAQTAVIVIRNHSDGDLEYGYWQKGSNTAKVFSRLRPHASEEMPLLATKDSPAEVAIEGTLTSYRSPFWHHIPFLGQLWFKTVSESALSLSLTNGSGWVRY